MLKMILSSVGTHWIFYKTLWSDWLGKPVLLEASSNHWHCNQVFHQKRFWSVLILKIFLSFNHPGTTLVGTTSGETQWSLARSSQNFAKRERFDSNDEENGDSEDWIDLVFIQMGGSHFCGRVPLLWGGSTFLWWYSNEQFDQVEGPTFGRNCVSVGDRTFTLR